MEKKIVCINCPLGCNITVKYDSVDDTGSFDITGNTCKRGLAYAVSEITDPRRTVTSTVPVKSSTAVRVSVKTAAPVPRDSIVAVMKEIHNITVQAPVNIGNVIIKDCAGTGIDVVATDHVTE